MTDFESGVSSYVHGVARVENFFPVDSRGNAHVCCAYCDYFNGRSCRLTHEIVYGPDKYVGARCPMMMEGDTNGGSEI